MSTAPTLTRRNVLSSDDTTMTSRTATRSSSEADYTARRERYEKEVAAVKEAAEERKRRFMAKKIGGYAYGGTLPTGAAEAPEIPEYRQEIAGKATGKGIAPDPFADVLAYLEGEYSRAAAEEATIDIAESRKGYDIQLGNIEAQGAAIRAEEARQQAVARRYGYDSMRELQAATLEFKMGSYMRDIAPTATGGRVLREQWKPFLTDEGYAAAREAQGQARAAEVMENIVPAPMEAAGKLQRMQERMTRGASVADYGRSVQEALTPRVQAARDQVETAGGGIVEAYGDLERGISTKVKEILPDYGAVSPYIEPAIRIGTYMNPIEFFPRVFSGRDPLLEFRLGLAEGTYTGTREKPVTTAAMFALGFVMPAVGKVAGAGWGAAVGTVGKAGPYVTKIPAIGAGLARAGSIGAVAVPKLASLGIAGLYGAHVFEEYGGTGALNQTARQAGTTTGRLAATEWAPLAAGTWAGMHVWSRAYGFARTFGTQSVDIEQIGYDSSAGFPVSSRITEPALRTSFYRSTLIPAPTRMSTGGSVPYVPTAARLPGEEGLYLWTGWESPVPRGGMTIAGGHSELPGMYTSPVALGYFSKPPGAISNYNAFGWSLPTFNTPTIIRTGVASGRMARIPASVVSRGPAAVDAWWAAHAEPGIPYMPLNKMEYESILPPGTVIGVRGVRYFTRVGGVRVPIQEVTAFGGYMPEIPDGLRPSTAGTMAKSISESMASTFSLINFPALGVSSLALGSLSPSKISGDFSNLVSYSRRPARMSSVSRVARRSSITSISEYLLGTSSTSRSSRSVVRASISRGSSRSSRISVPSYTSVMSGLSGFSGYPSGGISPMSGGRGGLPEPFIPFVPPPTKKKQQKQKRRRDIFAIGRYDIAHPVWTPEEVLLGGFEPMPKTGKMFDIEVFEAGRSRRVKRKKRK